MFGTLVKQNKIDPKYSGFRALLTKASAEKSEYDYKGTEVGQEEAKKWIRDAEKVHQERQGAAWPMRSL